MPKTPTNLRPVAPKRARTTRTPAEKGAILATLDANGGNVKRTVRDTGVPRGTLRDYAAQEHSAEVQAARAESKEALHDLLEGLAYQIVGLMPEKLPEGGLRELGTVLGITVDKMLLLRGQPTQITANAELTPEQRAARVVELVEQARARGVA